MVEWWKEELMVEVVGKGGGGLGSAHDGAGRGSGWQQVGRGGGREG